MRFTLYKVSTQVFVSVIGAMCFVAAAGAEQPSASCSIYTVASDGRDVQYVGGAPGYHGAGSPVFSPDGAMIAFDAYKGFFEYQSARVFVYAAEGPFRGTFRDLGYGNVPSWSPDGRQIAFMLNPGTPDGEEPGIWIMNSDGTERRWITGGWAPSWSPDGTRIAYQSPDGGVWVYNVAEESIDGVTPEDFSDVFAGAAWSPDSKQLAFIGQHQGERKLATIDADGNPESLRVLFTENESIGFPRARPAWSPAGDQIVFCVRQSEPPSYYERVFENYIYSMAANVPSAPALLEGAKHGRMNTSPSFSPDGKRIVFSSQR